MWPQESFQISGVLETLRAQLKLRARDRDRKRAQNENETPGVRFTKTKIWEFPILSGSRWGRLIFKMVPQPQVYIFFASGWTGADLAPGHLLVKQILNVLVQMIT